jgi:hypothetical protein
MRCKARQGCDEMESTVRDVRRIEEACEKWVIPERQARIGCWGSHHGPRLRLGTWTLATVSHGRARQARLSPRAGSMHSPIAVSFLCPSRLFLCTWTRLARYKTRLSRGSLTLTPLAALRLRPFVCAFATSARSTPCYCYYYTPGTV